MVTRNSKSNIVLAAMVHDTATVRRLLKEGVSPNEEFLGYTPLDFAIIHRDLTMMRDLLDADASMNAKGFLGSPPVLTAIRYGFINGLQLLIDRGVSLERSSLLHKSPLDAARKTKNERIISMVETEAKRRKDEALKDKLGRELSDAAHAGNIKKVRELIKKGAPFDREGNLFGIALHSAIDKGDYKIIELLINADADVNQISHDRTPLMMAALRGQADIATLLLEHGADISIKDSVGKDALTLAKEVLSMDWKGDAEARMAQSDYAVMVFEVVQTLEKHQQKLDNAAAKNKLQRDFALAAGQNDVAAMQRMLDDAGIDALQQKGMRDAFAAAYNQERDQALQFIIDHNICMDGINIADIAPAYGRPLAIRNIILRELVEQNQDGVEQVMQRSRIAAKAPFLRLIAAGDAEAVRKNMDECLWQKKPSPADWDALHVALQQKDTSMMRLLITWGAEVPVNLRSNLTDDQAMLLEICGLRYSDEDRQPKAGTALWRAKRPIPDITIPPVEKPPESRVRKFLRL